MNSLTMMAHLWARTPDEHRAQIREILGLTPLPTREEQPMSKYPKSLQYFRRLGYRSHDEPWIEGIVKDVVWGQPHPFAQEAWDIFTDGWCVEDQFRHAQLAKEN